jgi:hypothetical protein
MYHIFLTLLKKFDNGKKAPVWKITNLGAGFYDITTFANVERISSDLS